MNTISALTLIFVQLAIVLAAIIYDRTQLIDAVIIYGSPMYFVTHMGELPLNYYAENMGRLMFFSFHTFKYFFLIRAFTRDSPSMQRIAALVMELAYMLISYYYISSFS